MIYPTVADPAVTSKYTIGYDYYTDMVLAKLLYKA